MGSPGAFGDTPFMMGREATRFAHKTKRVLLSHPGKPLRCIRLKWEQTLLRTGHDVASSLIAILDTRDDMGWLGRRFRFGGSRGSGLGRRLAYPAGLGRNCWDKRL